MLRSLLSGVMRSRTRTPVGAGYGRRGHAGGGSGTAVGAQVGRSLFSALRRRR